MVLEGENIRLRPMRFDEAEALRAIADDAHIARFLSSHFPHPYTLKDADDFISIMMQSHATPHPLVFAIAHKETDALMGCCGLDGDSLYPDQPSLGYWMGRPYWQQGYTREAAQVLIKYGFEDLALPLMYVAVGTDNEPSLRIARGLGFSKPEAYEVAPTDNPRGHTSFLCFSMTRAAYLAKNKPASPA